MFSSATNEPHFEDAPRAYKDQSDGRLDQCHIEYDPFPLTSCRPIYRMSTVTPSTVHMCLRERTYRCRERVDKPNEHHHLDWCVIFASTRIGCPVRSTT